MPYPRAINNNQPKVRSPTRPQFPDGFNILPARNLKRVAFLISPTLANQLFDQVNRPRVLRRNFARLRETVAIQKWTRGAKAKADAVAALSLQRRTFQTFRLGAAVVASAHLFKSRAHAFANRKLVARGWRALRDHPAEKKVVYGFIFHSRLLVVVLLQGSNETDNQNVAIAKL